MSKTEWKSLVMTRVTVFHERELRDKARTNYKLEYLNVQALGLTGRPHPAICSVMNTRDAYKMRSHLKFLTGDIESFHNLSIINSENSPHCRLCSAECEHTQHILTECRGTSDVRERLYPELVNLVFDILPTSGILINDQTSNSMLTQFILDPTSLNLPNTHRISFQHPRLSDLYRLSQDWCNAVYSCRPRLLKELKSKHSVLNN